MERLTIGALAKRSGISVRMLRHYDDIGLLRPARRSDSGYRVYAPADLQRLQAIVALRQLGFGLKAIGELLDNRTVEPAEIMAWRLEQLDVELAQRERLRATLRGLLERLACNDQPSIDDLLATIEEMTTMERVEAYYTEEQLQELARTRDALGEDGMRQAEAAWATLIDEVRTLVADGVPPGDPRAKAAADRWMALVESFTGDDPGISRNLQKVWESEEEIAGFNAREIRALGEYIGKASKA